MNEPRRLREESGSDLERALLNAGVSYQGSAETRAKALAALGLAGSAAVLVGNASAATLSSVAKLTFAKVVAAVSLAGAIAVVPVGYYAWHRQDGVASTRRGGTSRVTATAPVKLVEPERLAAEDAPLAPRASERANVAAPSASRGAPTVARPSKPQTKSSRASAILTRELAALDAARSALANGQARDALSLLDAYTRDFRHGHLEIEAEVLRIDALASSGRGDAAKGRAEAFVRRYPSSVFAQRVRGYLDN